MDDLLVRGSRLCVLLNAVTQLGVPDWWPYPPRCQAGHAWGPGRVIVSWSPCDCPGAMTDPGRGHQVVRCGEPGCTSAWYRPRHGWPPGPAHRPARLPRAGHRLDP